MRARVTPDDLAAGTLVDPDWYPMEIVDYKEEAANTDGSTNALITLKVLPGYRNDKFKGARCRKLYNEKAMGFAAPLLVALGAKVDKETGIDADLSEETLKGRRVDVHIRRGETNKKNPFNDPVEFAPIGSVTKWKEQPEAVKA
jgi:hypothetical protein